MRLTQGPATQSVVRKEWGQEDVQLSSSAIRVKGPVWARLIPPLPPTARPHRNITPGSAGLCSKALDSSDTAQSHALVHPHLFPLASVAYVQRTDKWRLPPLLATPAPLPRDVLAQPSSGSSSPRLYECSQPPHAAGPSRGRWFFVRKNRRPAEYAIPLSVRVGRLAPRPGCVPQSSESSFGNPRILPARQAPPPDLHR